MNSNPHRVSLPFGAMEVFAGVWRMRLGSPEAFTPVGIRRSSPAAVQLKALPAVGWPDQLPECHYRIGKRGCTIELPLDICEGVYGLGLQLRSHRLRGKKTLRVNADPCLDLGDSHAPVPFYVTTAGYGVFVDTARYASFYIGSHARRDEIRQRAAEKHGKLADNTNDLYRGLGTHITRRRMVIDIPAAAGVDVYVFAGPTILHAIQRYNLFSGGGCLPPLWGLGVWYRAYLDLNQDQVCDVARELRETQIPCDVLGLEPGWQSTAYPNSFVWDRKRYPDPSRMLQQLHNSGFHINLWENAFVGPDSPMFKPMRDHCGAELSTDGLVPDFLTPVARQCFIDHHDQHFVSAGVSGFKLDECDNSDFTGAWSFPEYTTFPSGADGEQMHSLLGMLYQQVMDEPFRERGLRHYSQVRSSGALASSLPYVLYSDLYDHTDFIRGVVNSGFSGLLWSPEVRHAASPEDLVRRLETTVFSAQTLVNAWYIRNPPWFQVDTQKNNEGQMMPESPAVLARCRDLLRLRMQLLPYLYSAFWKYRWEGIPPLRALVVDFPDDLAARDVDDQYLFGQSMLVAPLKAGERGRSVYLPAGTDWYCFWTHQRHSGGQSIRVEGDDLPIPVFVRSGTIVPIAEAVSHVSKDTVFHITARIYGSGPSEFTLVADDGLTYAFEQGEFARLKLAWTAHDEFRVVREGTFRVARYKVAGHQRIV